MHTGVCGDPDCPNKRRMQDLEKELRAIYRLLEARKKDEAKCPAHPKGERCVLEAGHEGGHKWGSGD